MNNTTEESDELAQFRRQWRSEVEHRKRAAESASVPHQGDSAEPSEPVVKLPPHTRRASHEAPHVAPSTRRASFVRPAVDNPALPIYRNAVAEEQRGDYEAAVQLYRQAFRIDPNVDRVYHHEERRNTQQKEQKAKHVSQTSDDLSRDMHKLVIHETSHGDTTARATLAAIVAQFPDQLSFEPADERLGPPIFNRLPYELLVYLLKKMNITTLERFAAVCRRARAVTLDSGIWRERVLNIYRPPQIKEDVSLPDLLASLYLGDLRRMFIEQPRVRLDGVYIAVCHYTRSGLSENSWVNLTHFITYHRYLRFYPNGQVLSLLANEEFNPQQVIPLLKPSLRMKGFYIGQWALDGETVYISDLFDASGKHHVPGSDIQPMIHTHGHHASTTTHVQPAKYVFQMTLHLRSRPMLGRWNKLELKEYDSVDIETGETCALPTKHDRPFWFSKVRSYVTM